MRLDLKNKNIELTGPCQDCGFVVVYSRPTKRYTCTNEDCKNYEKWVKVYGS